MKGVTGVGIGVTGAWTGSGVDGTIPVKKSLRGFASIGLAVKGVTGVGIGVTGAGIGVTGAWTGAGVRRGFSTTGFGVTGFFPTALTCMNNVRIDPPFQKLKYIQQIYIINKKSFWFRLKKEGNFLMN